MRVLLLLLTFSLSAATGEAGRNVVVGDDPDQFPLGWTDGACYLPIKNVRVGDTIQFDFTGHNVYKMKSVEAYNTCDFSSDGAEPLANAFDSPYTYTITEKDIATDQTNQTQKTKIQSLYFACGIGSHCNGQQKIRVDIDVSPTIMAGTKTSSIRDTESPERKPVSDFVLGADALSCERLQNGEIMSIKNRFDDATCSEPVHKTGDYGRKEWFRTCLSPPITMTPGGVVNQAVVLRYPFPTDRRVVLGRRVWEFLQGDDKENLQPVYVNQLYVHHITGGIVMGNGAESIRRYDEDAPFPPPYAKLSGDFNDKMVFHLIDIRETGNEWLECVECRCRDLNGTYLDFGGSGGDGRATETQGGGINCCSNCTTLTSPTIDYRLRYNVSWSEIPEGETVRPIKQLMFDIAHAINKSVEYDVPKFDLLPDDQRLKEDPTIQVLEMEGRLRDLVREGLLGSKYRGPDFIEIHRCTGHMHIAGLGQWLKNAETGEIICHNNVTYGTDQSTNKGFLTSVGTQNYDPPIVLSANMPIRVVTHYNASITHTGVMGYLILFVSEHVAKGGGNYNYSVVEVGPKEAALTVDLCAPSKCDTSLLPSVDPSVENISYCEDTISSSNLCSMRNICDCESFFKLPSNFQTGCGGNIVTPQGNYSINFCDKTCGCQNRNYDANKMKTAVVKERFEKYYGAICKYATDECQRYLSNLYVCAERWEEYGIHPIVRDVMFKKGSDTVLKHARLGDSAMHTLDYGRSSPKILTPRVLPCTRTSMNDNSGTISNGALGLKLVSIHVLLPLFLVLAMCKK